MRRWKAATLAAGLLGLGMVAPAVAEDAFDRAGRAIEQGANRAGRAIGDAADQAGRGIEQGARQVGRAVDHGAREVGTFAERSAHEVGRATGLERSPPPPVVYPPLPEPLPLDD